MTTRKELANAYCVSTRTLYRWLRSINFEGCNRRITPKELQIIFIEFGDPAFYREIERSKKATNS